MKIVIHYTNNLLFHPKDELIMKKKNLLQS